MTAVEGTRFVLIDARSDVLELWEELLRDTVGLEANVECFGG